MKVIIYFALLMLTLTCKKEKSEAQLISIFDTTVHCPESVNKVFAFPEVVGSNGSFPSDLHLSNDTMWKYPCFNPLNSQEISFVQYPANAPATFYKYNILTGAKTLLVGGIKAAQQPVWCMNNWAYFMGYGRNMVRVNMETGEVNKLTNLNQDIYITSNILSGQFTCQRQITNTEMYRIRFDRNGIILDTMSNGCKGDWRNSLHAGGEKYSALVCIDAQTYNVEIINRFPMGTRLMDVKIHPNNLDIYCTLWYNSGMYKANRITKELTLLKEGNNSCWYDTFSISQDGKYIVFEKVICEIPSNTLNVFKRSEIWIMDIDGCNERRLFPSI